MQLREAHRISLSIMSLFSTSSIYMLLFNKLCLVLAQCHQYRALSEKWIHYLVVMVDQTKSTAILPDNVCYLIFSLFLFIKWKLVSKCKQFFPVVHGIHVLLSLSNFLLFIFFCIVPWNWIIRQKNKTFSLKYETVNIRKI